MDQNEKKYMEEEHAHPLDEQTLQRFVDGRLDATEQEALQIRLKRDATSRRRLDALREEDRLIGHSLEALSEPPVKISEKVMTVLYAEFNKRQNLIRARRFRRRLFMTLSAAAVLMLTVMFIQPRPPAGVYVSGRGVLDQSNKGKIAFEKGVRFYEGDVLITGVGQFMRVRLSEGSLVELGEYSQLKVVRFKDNLVRTELESGRVRVLVSDQNQEFIVRALEDEVRAAPGASIDLRKPRPVNAVWPHWAEPFQVSELDPRSNSVRERTPACLFVSKGQAELVVRKSGQTPVLVSTRQVICFGRNQKPTLPLQIGAVPAGQEDRWFEENSIPQDRAQLGLLEPIAWDKLSARMGLKTDLPGGQTAADEMSEVFREFDSANAIIDPSARAEALGKGLLRLRSAAERLVLRDARRWRERTIEGLVHYERGRALLATKHKKSQAAARDAFLDACIAFEEALSGGDEVEAEKQYMNKGNGENDSVKAPGLATLSAPKIEKHTRLSDLSPDEEAYLFAVFFKPWSEYHLMQTVRLAGSDDEGLASEERDPATGFKKAEAVLGRSVEILAARYGLGMALEQAGRLDKAEAAFRDLESTSVAGHGRGSRACAEGLRQAALVKLAEMFSRHGDQAKLQNTLDLFRIRYPLDTHTRAGIALRSIEKQKTP